MTHLPGLPSPATLWMCAGCAGAVLFYGRFYVQWYASERRGEVVIPAAFWYMSSAGALLTFAYSVWNRSPGAAFGLCFSILIYARNIALIWRDQRRLTRFRSLAVHALAVLVAAGAVGLTLHTWGREVAANRALDPASAARNWFWLKMWGVGQACFFLRFLIQWIASELGGKSVVPGLFWRLSLAAALLQAPGFIFRSPADWINAAGQLANSLVYARNIMIARRAHGAGEAGRVFG